MSSLKNKTNGGEYRAKREIAVDVIRAECDVLTAWLNGHYAAECRKPKKDIEQRLDINMAQT